ncbi:PAS domain-containing protein [Desulfobulbus alkaliphilus]|nr:PAS domain-containing protein [Desulfobulbus alkaliphilus]
MPSEQTTAPHGRCDRETYWSPGTWRAVFNGIEDPCLVVRPDGIIIEVNDATLRAAQKSREEVIGQGVCKIIHGGRWPHLECPLEEFLKNCTPKTEETCLPGLSGEYSFSISPVKNTQGEVDTILLIARELTRDELRKVDYFRSAKLAALGELAAGVAHEVNNPITGIINFAQILLDTYDLDPAGVDMLQKIMKEGDRIATITRNLISFARADIGLREPVDPVEVVDSSLDLVNHQLLKDGIKVIKVFPSFNSFIIADFRKLQQVFLNFISNSRYALNNKFKGLDENKKIEIIFQGTNNDKNNFYKIIFKDYGTGLPQSILEHVFEPFFSTKPPGEGTGLGLSISYGIIKEHDGNLYLNSIVDKFTEIIIELPIGR